MKGIRGGARHRPITLAIAAAAAALTGCVVAFVPNFSFPGVPCRMQNGWCIVDVPGAGLLAVGAGSDGTPDRTTVSFRFAPREGHVAAWASADVTVVDLTRGTTMQMKALHTQPVTGRRLLPDIGEELWPLYGPYTQGHFRLQPRITDIEVRFPPLLVDGRSAPVTPVRIHDGTRMPRAFLAPH